MRLVARVYVATLMVALSTFSCQARKEKSGEPVVVPPLVVETPLPEFRLLEGQEPGLETPYNGKLLHWARWADATGNHVIILSVVAGTSLLEGYPDRVTLQARHYHETHEGLLLAQRMVDSIDVPFKETRMLLYKDTIWVYDLDGDGRGEALFAYYLDQSREPGPKRLGLMVFCHQGTYGVYGSTRYDPPGKPSITSITVPDQAFTTAPGYIIEEAQKLWNEAQFYLAEPPAFPGFLEYQEFDGATFRGDEPLWSLMLLPSHMVLSTGSAGVTATIGYTSISRTGADADTGIVIEGAGMVEAWNHTFRVTIAKEPVASPNGAGFPYSAIMEWSDGTRLVGWGKTREVKSSPWQSGLLEVPPQIPLAETQ